MTDRTDPDAARAAAGDHAAQMIAVMARQLASRPVLGHGRLRAGWARLLALRRLAARPGAVILPPAGRRLAVPVGDRQAIGRDAPGFVTWPGARRAIATMAIARPSAASRMPLLTRAVRMISAAPAARAAGTKGAVPAILARGYSAPGARPVTAPRLLAALTRSAGAAQSGGGDHQPIRFASKRPTISPQATGEARRRGASLMAGTSTAGVGQRQPGPVGQHASTPSFDRTVRQPQASMAPGNVYLDKALVGRHLAAAVTAEQTRAAARPDISGTRFNRSMAPLRPSGGGL